MTLVMTVFPECRAGRPGDDIALRIRADKVHLRNSRCSASFAVVAR